MGRLSVGTIVVTFANGRDTELEKRDAVKLRLNDAEVEVNVSSVVVKSRVVA